MGSPSSSFFLEYSILFPSVLCVFIAYALTWVCGSYSQNVISGLSGASVGSGFSVTTWSPFLCLLPNSVKVLVWVQFTLFLAALPLAAGVAAASHRVSQYIWKGPLILVCTRGCVDEHIWALPSLSSAALFTIRLSLVLVSSRHRTCSHAPCVIRFLNSTVRWY